MRLVKMLFMLAVLFAVVSGFYTLVPFGPGEETFVEIAPGTGTAGIAQQLQQAGVVRSALAFEALKLYGKVASGTGSQTLKAGEYRFDHAAPLIEVYDRIRHGDVYTVTLVVPEGFNIFDVADAVAKAGLGTRDDFLLAERQHVELVRAWNPKAVSVEGYLFPDTYRFQRKATPLQIITAMVKRFGQVEQRLGMKQDVVIAAGPSAAPQEVSMAAMVTLASLVEKEVHLDGERPMVAGVFMNRLAAGMPLQTDPAVIYASLLRGTWTGVIHQSELASDSPYNTYRVKGLPPGPICNPGVAALRAAMKPSVTDALYFVAGPGGTTRFARTLSEHNGNVAEYRRDTK